MYWKKQEMTTINSRKLQKAPKKAEKKVKAEKTKAVEVVQVEEEEVEEEVKPRTPMEKLEYNANKAAIKSGLLWKSSKKCCKRRSRSSEIYEIMNEDIKQLKL